MSLDDLTHGAIPRMLQEDEASRIQDPVCQVLTVKKIQTQAQDAPDRYRVILSDGQLYAQGEGRGQGGGQRRAECAP